MRLTSSGTLLQEAASLKASESSPSSRIHCRLAAAESKGRDAAQHSEVLATNG
jgi:hypothetical protein